MATDSAAAGIKAQKEHTEQTEQKEQKELAVKLAHILLNDEWHCRCLLAAAAVMQSAGITHYLLSAGFVRDAVWDSLHGFTVSPSADVDLIYWGSGDLAAAKATEEHLNRALTQAFDTRWEVKDQRRMHLRHGDAPYSSLIEAMAVWPEQETAIGVRLHPNSEWMKRLESLCAPKLASVYSSAFSSEFSSAFLPAFSPVFQSDFQSDLLTNPEYPQHHYQHHDQHQQSLFPPLRASDLQIEASWGLAPLFALTLTPTATPSRMCLTDGGLARFYARVRAKNWQARYPKLQFNC